MVMGRMVRVFVASLPMVLLAVLLAVADCAPGWAATGSGARLGIHSDGVTRFVMDLSDTVEFKVSTQADPYRVTIDSPDLEVSGNSGIRKPWGSVNGMRAEAGRVVLDLRKPALVKQSFIIPPRDGLGWRLVIDLADTTREAFLASVTAARPVAKANPLRKSVPAVPVAAPKPAPVPVPAAEPPPAPVEAASPPAPGRIVLTSPNAPAAEPAPESAPAPLPADKPARTLSGLPMLSAPMPPPPERPVPPPVVQAPVPVPQPVAVAPQPQPQLQPHPQTVSAPKAETPAKGRDGIPVIVIDPGHGGVDPGATGVSGIYEKHITLSMARELKAALEKGGRYKVHLTRDRDVFIRLRDRVAIARQQGADLFISLHADAVQSPQIRGLSVYTLSQTASSSEAQTLAEKENKADLIAGIDLSHESADVAGILIDLAQRETMNRSAGFATEMVDEVGQELDLLDNTHRFAGFAVLKAPDVPAVLVEMGYLSNEYEEKQLRQPVYRARLAKAISKAVERFFPPSLKAKRP
ncbi:N-acetylmuramoyl-L-alanine amidase [Candidatus Terasakiella magnetica]|nr:N-acetylmuramoyl-L-alanine amidase [Candidatus Terasakiella magnetica]